MDYTEIIYDKADRVATVTFNRPQALNAYTPTLGLELKTALHEADADNEVGAIIVTGAGRSFCSGFDVKVGAQANKALRSGQSQRLQRDLRQLRLHASVGQADYRRDQRPLRVHGLRDDPVLRLQDNG